MRRVTRITILSASVCALFSGLAPADVYKYTDENGNVQYTDKPRTLPAERLNVQTQRTDVVAVQARAADELQRMQETTQARQQVEQERAEERRATQMTAEDQAERCTKARQRYDTYMNSQRLYEALPDGERRYLTDAELDATRASAKASMDVLCK